MHKLSQDLIDKLNKYKKINTRNYQNVNQHIFIEKLIQFYKEKSFLTPRQQESLEKNLDSFFNFVEKYPPRNNIWIGEDFLKENNMFNKLLNKHGVYFLYNENDTIIYIGKSGNLATRIVQSAFDKKAVGFSYIITESHIDCCILELYYISIYKPIFNSDPYIIDDVKNIKIEYNYEMSQIYKIKRSNNK